MKTRIIYGLSIGAAWFIGNLVNSILLFKGELVNMTGIVFVLEWLILIIVLWLGIRNARESTDEKSISYRKGLSTGFMISVFWGISSTGFALIYTTFFVKADLIRQINSLMGDYESMAGIIPMSWSLNNGLVAATYFARLYLHPLYMSCVETIVDIIMGTGISLVLAALVKRRLFGMHKVSNNVMMIWIALAVSILLVSSCSRSRPRPRPSGLFIEPTNSPIHVGSAPNSIAVGDFNGDGKPDLAIPNAGDNNITVLLGDGIGGFNAAVGSPFRVGKGPSAVAVGDFNGDGKLDLAISNILILGNSVTILIGNGNGGFVEAYGSPFKVGIRNFWLKRGMELPAFLAIDDFNGDGKLDIAISVFNDDIVKIMLGNGKGGFNEASGSPISVDMDPWALAVGDFNGDGRSDLVITSTGSNSVTVLLGNGMGGFNEATGSPFATGTHPISVAVGDFNCDSKQDLAIANYKSNNVTVLLGNGTGRFMEAPGSPFSVGSLIIPINVGICPFCVAVGDFNCDGKPDLAIANGSNNVTVGLGDGTGVFTEAHDSPFFVGSFPKWVIVSDFNSDGKPDLAIANKMDNNITILLNNYSGSGKGREESH